MTGAVIVIPGVQDATIAMVTREAHGVMIVVRDMTTEVEIIADQGVMIAEVPREVQDAMTVVAIHVALGVTIVAVTHAVRDVKAEVVLLNAGE